MANIKGYKAYDKGLICKGHKFEVGKTYETDKAEVCKTGFHLCENPFDCWNYYDVDSEYTEAEALGEVDRNADDSKLATTKIKIGAKLSLKSFIEAGINFLLEITKEKTGSGNWAKIGSSGDWAKIGSSGNWAKIGSSGDWAKIGSSGDWAKIGSSGNWAKIGSSGYGAKIELNGINSVGMCAGYDCKIKGKIGNWITLAEWKQIDDRWTPVCVKSAQIDGKILKEDTWYKLEDGEFKEVK